MISSCPMTAQAKNIPMINSSMFVIAVNDLAASADFYSKVLGFEVREIGDAGWRMFVKDNCRIMAGHCPDAMPPNDLGDHSYFAYLVVTDANKYFQEVKGAGAELLKELSDEPWGMREFAIRTIDGHRIMIGEEI